MGDSVASGAGGTGSVDLGGHILSGRATVPATPSGSAAQVVPVDHPVQLQRMALRLLVAGRVAAWVSILIGTAVLIGYLVRSPQIVRLAPSLPPMYGNAALGFVCGGAAALLERGAGLAGRRLAQFLSGFVFLIGAAGLILHLSGAPVGWYEVLWPDRAFVAATTPTPGRPVIESCLAFMLVGTSLALGALRRAPRVSQGLALGSLTVGLTAFVGFVLGVNRAELGGSFVVGMALHTSLGFLAVSLASLLSRPSVGVLALLTEGGISGRAARRLTLAVFAVPVTLATAQSLTITLLGPSPLASSVLTTLQVAMLGAFVMAPVALLQSVDYRARVQLLTERHRDEAAGDDDLVTETLAREMATPPPHVAGWQVAFYQEAAEGYVAGDSQQVLPRNDHHVLVAVIDAAGHGAEPAMVAMRLRSMVDALWTNYAPLDRIAHTLNAAVVAQHTIATCVLADVDVANGVVTFINCGHPPIVHLTPGGAEELRSTCPLLGIPEFQPRSGSFTVERGDTIALYTDGVTEARGSTGQLGSEALLHLLTTRATEGAEHLARACVDLAHEHAGGRLQDDALTVCLQRS
jgi:hypothetical protein